MCTLAWCALRGWPGPLNHPFTLHLISSVLMTQCKNVLGRRLPADYFSPLPRFFRATVSPNRCFACSRRARTPASKTSDLLCLANVFLGITFVFPASRGRSLGNCQGWSRSLSKDRLQGGVGRGLLPGVLSFSPDGSNVSHLNRYLSSDVVRGGSNVGVA